MEQPQGHSPSSADGEAFQVPFRARGMAVDEVFYFGGRCFCATTADRALAIASSTNARAHARRLGGFRRIALRRGGDAHELRCSPGHRCPNDAFWTKRG